MLHIAHSSTEMGQVGTGQGLRLVNLDLERILGNIIDTEFIVQVRPGRPTSGTDVTDHVTLLDFHALVHTRREPTHMAIGSGVTGPMFKYHQITVATGESGHIHHAIG